MNTKQTINRAAAASTEDICRTVKNASEDSIISATPAGDIHPPYCYREVSRERALFANAVRVHRTPTTMNILL